MGPMALGWFELDEKLRSYFREVLSLENLTFVKKLVLLVSPL